MSNFQPKEIPVNNGTALVEDFVYFSIPTQSTRDNYLAKMGMQNAVLLGKIKFRPAGYPGGGVQLKGEAQILLMKDQANPMMYQVFYLDGLNATPVASLTNVGTPEQPIINGVIKVYSTDLPISVEQKMSKAGKSYIAGKFKEPAPTGQLGGQFGGQTTNHVSFENHEQPSAFPAEEVPDDVSPVDDVDAGLAPSDSPSSPPPVNTVDTASPF